MEERSSTRPRLLDRAYAGFDGVVAALRTLPGARSLDVGRSRKGVPLPCVELGDPAARDVSVLLAGIHALEWIGVASALVALEELAAELPAGRRVLAFPIVNVDGYRQVEDDLREGKRRWRRGNANGVDLNRNFPTGFRARTVASTVLPFVYAPGPAPLSEPETRAIEETLRAAEAKGARVTHAISLHSIGKKVLHPYGHRWSEPNDVLEHRVAARAFANAVDGYAVEQCSRWVPGAFAYGMEIDHLHDAHGALALLVEIGNGSARPWKPLRYLSPFDVFNPADPRDTARRVGRAAASFLRGRIGG